MNYNLYEFSKGPTNIKFHKLVYGMLTAFNYATILFLAVSLVIAISMDNWAYVSVAVFLGAYFLTKYILKHFYNFYDYTFVSGSVRIIKVENNKRRRLLSNFDAKNMVSLGKVGGETYTKYVSNKQITKIVACPDGVCDDDIAIYYSENGENKLLIIPFDEMFLAVLTRYTGNRKIDKDFLETLKSND
ncbi:MAG: hypothetical protein J6R88_03640 [Clostridia bacterium]|nr:hypothetical protein [Clostridia bacterium]